MFYEFNNTCTREEFKFSYIGKELIEPAIVCRNRFKQQEMEARKTLANLMLDPNVSQSDKRIEELKRDIERNGKQYEACSVFVIGFKREPDRVFRLALGDIVFFDLVS